MPNRILKDSICTSDNLDQLTPEQEVFWYRLLVQCDDSGSMDASPAILRAKCFPLKLQSITDAAILDWLRALARAKLIRLYVLAGKPYIQVATWETHQQIRSVDVIDVLAFIRQNYEPDEVYDKAKLAEWALNHGFLSR